jgi:hypothetical protein
MSGGVPWICVRKGTEASQSPIPGAKRSFQVIKLSNLSKYPYDSIYIFVSVKVSTSNGKSYNLTKEEQVKASKILKMGIVSKQV